MKSVNFPWSTKLEYLTVWIFIPYWSVKFKFTCTVWIFFLFLFFIMCRCCSWQKFFDQYGYMTSIFKFLNVWNNCNLILRIIIAQRRMHGKPLWIFSFQDFIRIFFGIGLDEGGGGSPKGVHLINQLWQSNRWFSWYFLDTSQFNYVSTQDSQSLQWYDCGHHFPASLGAKAI